MPGSTSYAVNGLNQYLSAGGAAVTHDLNGNMTSDGATTFAYDVENRLVSASGAKNAALAYDPLGRLWQVTSGGATTRFLYDGDRLLEERDVAGTLTAGKEEPGRQIRFSNQSHREALGRDLQLHKEIWRVQHHRK